VPNLNNIVEYFYANDKMVPEEKVKDEPADISLKVGLLMTDAAVDPR
jgi:hypothetical protein